MAAKTVDPHLCLEYFPTSPYCASAAPRHIAPCSWKFSSREDIRPTSTCACSLGWDLAALRQGEQEAQSMEINSNTSVRTQQGTRRRYKSSMFDAPLHCSSASAPWARRLFRACSPRWRQREKRVQKTGSAFPEPPLE